LKLNLHGKADGDNFLMHVEIYFPFLSYIDTYLGTCFYRIWEKNMKKKWN